MDWFMAASTAHPYAMGFVKFAVLASFGEILALRLTKGGWQLPVGFGCRAVIWGCIGMVIALMFTLFDGGVRACMAAGYLPNVQGQGIWSLLLTAFFISTLCNLIFGPTFMGFHRITDTWISLGEGKLSNMRKLSLAQVLEGADLTGFVRFVVCKTIPLFWIPAHTVTFMLPAEYRVLMAAFLSICLGAILGYARKGK